MRRTPLQRRTPLRRTGPLRSRAPRDSVPSHPGLFERVIERDRRQMLRAGLPTEPVCIAPIVDPAERGRCWGRTTLDHVKDEPRTARKATSEERHLVSACQGHTEDGRQAGHQWNTANRPVERDYLAKLYPGEEDAQ